MLQTGLIIGFTLLGQAVTAAYVYGKLTQKVNDTRQDVTEVRVQVLDHETRISRMEGAGARS